MARQRPRIARERRREVYAAARTVLVASGYDLFTFDAVAARARASKATLYRHWPSKASLVVAAIKDLSAATEATGAPDCGSLREDLIALYGGCDDLDSMSRVWVLLYVSVATAIPRQADLSEAFRREVAPLRGAEVRQAWERAYARGEISGEADLGMLSSALDGLVLQHAITRGLVPDRTTMVQLIDQIVLTAAVWRSPTGSLPVIRGGPLSLPEAEGRSDP